jgi:hypothetical protein
LIGAQLRPEGHVVVDALDADNLSADFELHVHVGRVAVDLPTDRIQELQLVECPLENRVIQRHLRAVGAIALARDRSGIGLREDSAAQLLSLGHLEVDARRRNLRVCTQRRAGVTREVHRHE